MTAHHLPTASIVDHLDALANGAELATAKRGDKAKPSDAIWYALHDALAVVEGSNDREQRWLRPASSAGTWNRIGLTVAEARQLAKLQIHAGLKPWADTTMVRREDGVDRAMTTLEWFRWLSRFPDAVPLHHAAVELLKGDKQNKASTIWRPNREHSRQTVSEIKAKTLAGITAGFLSLGIMPGVGCSWVSIAA